MSFCAFFRVCVAVALVLSHFLVEHQQEFRDCVWSRTFPDLLFIFTLYLPVGWVPHSAYMLTQTHSDQVVREDIVHMVAFKGATGCQAMGYLTGRQDELVTGQVRLITKDVRLFRVELFGSSQKSQEMIVNRHSCNCLKDAFGFVRTKVEPNIQWFCWCRRPKNM